MIAAAEEERFRRIKHWAGFPIHAISYCLNQAGIRLSDIEHIALNQDNRANLARKIGYFLLKRPDINLVFSRLRNRLARAAVPVLLEQAFPGEILRAKLHRVEHHLAHLSSAFHVCPFDRAAVVSIDGFGDFSSAAWGEAAGCEISTYGRVYFPHSLGIFYQALTQYLGFPHYGDEYKVMGLAPYGRVPFLDSMRKIVRLLPHGGFDLVFNFSLHVLETSLVQWAEVPPESTIFFRRRLSSCWGLGACRQIRSSNVTATSPARLKRCMKKRSSTSSAFCKNAPD